jgi:hypothetical protein
MLDFILQIDQTSVKLFQEYVYGSFIAALIGGIAWLAIQLVKERNKNHELALKAIEALGTNNEIIRNNTEVLNQIKGKL